MEYGIREREYEIWRMEWRDEMWGIRKKYGFGIKCGINIMCCESVRIFLKDTEYGIWNMAYGMKRSNMGNERKDTS